MATRLPWHATAAILVRELGRTSDADRIGVIKRAAVGVAGCPIDLIDRYVAVYRRVEDLAASRGLDTDALLVPDFAATEAGLDLEAVDPAFFLASLGRLHRGEATLSGLHDELEARRAAEGPRIGP